MTDEEFIKSWERLPSTPNSFMIYRGNKHAELKLLSQLSQGEKVKNLPNFKSLGEKNQMM
ncbi:14452_t:CDS:2 [Rhizophagus irregularis]|nr:14452_t:CDS:2 [Rhizophagus irregularis]